MSTATEDFLAVDAQVPNKVWRDGWGRPLIDPVDDARRKMRQVRGTDPFGNVGVFQTDKVAYTRASTLGKALDDEAGLTKWKQRMTALGIAKRRDLILAVNAHSNDKKMVGDLVDQAMDAAESGAAATSGTALHEILDAYEQGRTPYVPEEYKKDVEAYLIAIRGLEFVRSETFVVDDELECAGSYDNLWKLKYHATPPDGITLTPGTLIIGDKKTGQEIKFGHCSWGVQEAVYAHGVRYDPATNTRLDPEPINKDWGIIAHVPVMRGEAQLYWIDLRKGRELAHLASTVRTARKTKTMTAVDIAPTWADQIVAASSLDVLRNVWIACAEAQEATDEIKAAMIARSEELAA